MSAEMLERLRTLSTSSLSDALDKLGCPGSVHGLAPLNDGQRLVGTAYTVRYVPIGASGGTVGDYIDDVGLDQVVVLDNGGRTDCTVWGDILTTVAHSRRIAGTVIYGVCRDTARARELHYPIYSSGRFMRTGKDRVAVVETQATVRLGDVQVQPGDFVVGDDDGVVVIASARVTEVAAIAESISANERQLLDLALESGSLSRAREQFGYHQLQRKPS